MDNHPVLLKYAEDSTLIPVIWSNSCCCMELVDKFFNWSQDNSICNPSKCKELIFCNKGFTQDIAPVNNTPQCAKLKILGVTFQGNCKYSVRGKLIKGRVSAMVKYTSYLVPWPVCLVR